MDSSLACSYQHFDSDGNGELDEKEIQQALQHAGLLPIGSATPSHRLQDVKLRLMSTAPGVCRLQVGHTSIPGTVQ